MDNFTVAVTIGSRNLKVTSDGTEEGTVFDGKVGDVKMATSSAKRQDPVSFGKFGESPIANSGFDSPIALTAALYSINPEMVRIVEAPKEVYEFLNLSPEGNPEVVDTAAKNSGAVSSEVLTQEVPSQQTMEPRYSEEQIQIVQQNGIYGEVALSVIISMACIIWFILMQAINISFTSLAFVFGARIIALPTVILALLAIYCAIKAVIKIQNNKENAIYTFVVLFLVFLPFVFLLSPETGFVPQLIDSYDYHNHSGHPFLDDDPNTEW